MLRYLLAVLALTGLDQWVKYWTVSHLALGETAPLLEGFLRLHRVHNTGGGWSILSGHTWLLTLLTAAVLAAILVLAARGAVRHPFGRWMAAVLFAGGLGNLIDRVRLGYVVDMFEFQFISYPVFNVADICIVAGVIGCALYYLFLHEKHSAPGKEGPDHGASAADGR